MTMDVLADIGATNARFGLMHADGPKRGEVETTITYKCEDYPGFQDAYRAFIAETGENHIRRTALAIAGPVTDDFVRMTNHPWAFSQKAVKEELGLDRFVVINDFTAVALSLAELREHDIVTVGGKGRPDKNFPYAVLGPGSGLGVSGLVPNGRGGYIPLSGEGGHVTLAPYNEREAEIIHILRERFGHVSAERVICGSGLVNLYRAIATLERKEPRHTKPESITKAALNGSDDMAVEALTVFCAMLGTIAGNLALTLGARGGLFIAGGIVPQMLNFFKESPFRDRFTAKGRFEDYLAAIPTYVIIHPLVAFLGLEASLESDLY